MSKISFRIVSIEFNNTEFNKINKSNLIGIRLIQMPQQSFDEFIVGNEGNLKNFDHEFYIENHLNSIDKIIMMIRSVQSCFFNENSNQNIVDKNDENCVDNSQSNNGETKKIDFKNKNVIGSGTIDMSKMEKGVNNTFSIDVFSKSEGKVVGKANLEIYIINAPSKICKTNNEIVFSQKESKPRHIVQPFVL